jgi:hypothetical protein
MKSDELSEAGRILGSVKSEKKAKASRENIMRAKSEGKTGGRPAGPQPWKALGISRQAWYARKGKEKGKGK